MNPIGAGAEPLAIVAAGGALPTHVAAAAAAAGRPVFVIGIEGEADPGISAFPHEWLKWGQIGRMLDLLAAHGAHEVVLVGAVRGRPNFRQIGLDWGAIKRLPQIVALMAGGDDSLLSGAVRMFEALGHRVVGAHEIAQDLVAGPGVVAGRAPGAGHQRDIAKAFDAARAIGALDIGQAAVSIGEHVIALEAAEGTDAMLERVTTLRSGGRTAWTKQGGVLAKCAKPQQDLRVDMPTIGPRTVEKAAEARLAGIAIEARRVMIADRQATIAQAEKAGLFIIAEAVEGQAAG